MEPNKGQTLAKGCLLDKKIPEYSFV